MTVWHKEAIYFSADAFESVPKVILSICICISCFYLFIKSKKPKTVCAVVVVSSSAVLRLEGKRFCNSSPFSSISSGFGHIYWRNPSWNTSFFVQYNLKLLLSNEITNEITSLLIPLNKRYCLSLPNAVLVQRSRVSLEG